MKAYTDIEQSKILKDILPLESADMHYSKDFDGSWFVDLAEYASVEIPKYVGNVEEHLLPCWSLSALLNVLPKRCNNDTVYMPLVGKYYEGNKFICGYFGDGLLDWTFGETPVDSCVAMIEKLHEQKLL